MLLNTVLVIGLLDMYVWKYTRHNGENPIWKLVTTWSLNGIYYVSWFRQC